MTQGGGSTDMPPPGARPAASLEGDKAGEGLAAGCPLAFRATPPPQEPTLFQQHPWWTHRSAGSVLVTPFPGSHGSRRPGLGFCQHLETQIRLIRQNLVETCVDSPLGA